MNLAIWDIESSSASTDFGSIIEIGGVLVDENFKEKDRFNLRCSLPCLLYTSPSPRDTG